MFSKEEILASLRDGLTADDIASSFAEVLNEALKEQKKTDTRFNDTKELYYTIGAYIGKYYPSLAEDMEIEPDDEEIERIIELMDTFARTYKALKKCNEAAEDGGFNVDSLQDLFNILGGLNSDE